MKLRPENSVKKIILFLALSCPGFCFPPGYEAQHTLQRRLRFLKELIMYPFTGITPVAEPELPDDHSWQRLEKWLPRLINFPADSERFANLYKNAFSDLLPEFANRDQLLFHTLSEVTENRTQSELHALFDLFGNGLPAFTLPKTHLALQMYNQDDSYGLAFLQELTEKKGDFTWEQAAGLWLLHQNKPEAAFLRLKTLPYREHLEEFHAARIQKKLTTGDLNGLDKLINRMEKSFPHIDTFYYKIMLLFGQARFRELIALAEQKDFQNLDPLCREYLVVSLCFNNELERAFALAATAEPVIELPPFPGKEELPDFYTALTHFMPEYLQKTIISHPETRRFFYRQKR